MNTNSFIEQNSKITLIVTETALTSRIDRYISQQLPNYSRNFFQQLIEQGYVTLNTTIVTKQSTPVTGGDEITLHFPPHQKIQKSELDAATKEISILYQNDHFMIINKPAHLLIHAPSAQSTAITVVDWITYNHDDIKHVGLVDRPGIVHRLDRETSGLLIVARTNYAHQTFNTLFQKREINKTYHAVVVGHPEKVGFIDYGIARDPYNRAKMKAFDSNHKDYRAETKIIRPSQTHYTVLEYFNNPDAALVELKPISGRTHQIRVHMTASGHPLIGDQLYSKRSSLINRHALHAYSLSFIFDNVPYSFTQEPPQDFQKLVSGLQTNSKPF